MATATKPKQAGSAPSGGGQKSPLTGIPMQQVAYTLYQHLMGEKNLSATQVDAGVALVEAHNGGKG